MSQNLEIKARFDSLARGRRIAASLGARPAGRLQQRDTFLMLVPGRLKLREETSSVPELIYYDRSQSRSRAGRISSFIRIPVADPQGLLRRWPQTRESRVVVRKERWLYLYRNARIHLDAVKGLGTFIEFEVLLIEGKRQANRLLADLVEAFGIRKSDTIGGAYADLLQR